jgi:hypothetical protein
MEQYSIDIIFPDKSKITINQIPKESTLYDIRYALLDNQKTINLKKDFYFSKNGVRLSLDTKADVEEVYLNTVNEEESFYLPIFMFFTIIVLYLLYLFKEDGLISCLVVLLYTVVLYDLVKKPRKFPPMNGVAGFFLTILFSFSPEFRLEDVIINE